MPFPVGPNEEERLKTLLETGILDTKQDPALNGICDEARRHFGVPMCSITLLDRTRQLIKAAHGLDVAEMPRDLAFCNYTILADEVFVIGDTLADERFKDSPLVTGAPYLRFYAGAPLIYLKSIRLGAFCLLDTKPHSFSRGDKAELQLFAERAVAELIARELDRHPQV